MVLDMGEPVPIVDLARRLIAESDRQIEIQFTGLRPGEKLHEVLSGPDEVLEPSGHPLISRVPVPPLSPTSLGLPRVRIRRNAGEHSVPPGRSPAPDPHYRGTEAAATCLDDPVWSSSVSDEPLGRQRPRAKISSATAPPITSWSANTGWQVHRLPRRTALDALGLQSAHQRRTRRPRPTAGSIWATVSQWLAMPAVVDRVERPARRGRRARRGSARGPPRRRSILASSPSSWPRPTAASRLLRR